jgi:hypothetical protein
MTFIRFYIFLIAITLIQIGVALCIPHLVPTKDVINAIFFMTILTALIYPIAYMGAGKKDGYAFIISAYLTIGIRFIFSIFYILYYRYTRTNYELGFIFSFFITYIFYTVFEITSLTAKLRLDLKEKHSSNESNNN